MAKNFQLMMNRNFVHNLKRQVCCFGITLIYFHAIGQQLPLSGLGYRQPFVFIPAYAGTSGSLVGMADGRSQWQGIEGNPETYSFRVEFPVFWYSLGAGLNLGKDATGLSQRIFVQPSMNKMFTLGSWLMSVGVHIEYSYHYFDGFSARTPDGIYQGGHIDHQDPVIPPTEQSFQLMDAGVSWAIKGNGFQGGLVANRLLQSGSKNLPIVYANKSHFGIHAAYKMSFQEWSIEPAVVLFSDLFHHQSQLFIQVEYNGNIFGGIHYRGYNRQSKESYGLSFGFGLNERWSVAYLHEFYLGGLSRSVVQKSQEFGIWYHLGRPVGQGRKPPQLRSPRYFD